MKFLICSFFDMFSSDYSKVYLLQLCPGLPSINILHTAVNSVPHFWLLYAYILYVYML